MHREWVLRLLRLLTSRGILFVAFAFTVMADPVSSIAYAIESALRHLDGDLEDLLLTMLLVGATITVIAATYHQLIRRFPEGGGGARSVGTAYGDAWAFIPLGALLVDFVITVAISCAAGASAIIAYVPALAPERVVLALALTALVAGGISLGHHGRVAFAAATLLFIALALTVIVAGAIGGPAQAPAHARSPEPLLSDAALIPALLAMPLAMALATGIEAPSDAIAQLGQLEHPARRRFGQWTIWLTVAIVGVLTVGVTILAVVRGVGLPPSDSTLLAEVARTSVGDVGVFAAFQVVSALLLLAAAASSYLAASGLLKALALVGANREGGLVPARFALLNRFHVPPWGILVVLIASAGLILMAGGRDQEIVRYYAVSVFAGFLGATIGCARLSHRDGQRAELAVNLTGIVLVAFVLSLNVARPAGVIVLSAAGIIAGYLYAVWVRRGRPAGVAEAELQAESEAPARWGPLRAEDA